MGKDDVAKKNLGQKSRSPQRQTKPKDHSQLRVQVVQEYSKKTILAEEYHFISTHHQLSTIVPLILDDGGVLPLVDDGLDFAEDVGRRAQAHQHATRLLATTITHVDQ